MVAARTERRQGNTDERSAAVADQSATRMPNTPELSQTLSVGKRNSVALGVLRVINPLTRRMSTIECSPQSGRLFKMLSRCANSQCGKPFLRLREGKLFLVETGDATKASESAAPASLRPRQARQVEHYWLCEDCSAQWTLIYARETGVTLAPLRRPAVGVPATAQAARHGAA